MSVRALAAAVSLSLGLAAAQTPGVAATTVAIGQTLPLSGPLGTQGLRYRQGEAVYFDRVNKRGGVNGRRIELVTLDDKHNSETAMSNLVELIDKRQVFALIGSFGTGPSEAAMGIVEVRRVPLVGVYSGSATIRQRTNFAFHVRASHNDEIARIVQHTTTLGIKRIALAYDEGALGQAVRETLETALKASDLKPAGMTPIQAEGANIQPAAKHLARVEAQAVIVAAGGTIAPRFIDAYRKHDKSAQFYVLSASDIDALIAELGAKSHGVNVAVVVPGVTSGIYRDYRTAIAEAGKTELSNAGFEGYITARVLVEGLTRAGAAPTRQSFMAGLESLQDLDLGGYAVTYGRNRRDGNRRVELGVIDQNGKLMR